MYQGAAQFPRSLHHEQRWHGETRLHIEHRVQVYRAAIHGLHGEQRGGGAAVDHLPVQLGQVEGGPHGGPSQGRQRVG
jgi:hypothetical protein